MLAGATILGDEGSAHETEDTCDDYSCKCFGMIPEILQSTSDSYLQGAAGRHTRRNRSVDQCAVDTLVQSSKLVMLEDEGAHSRGRWAQS